MVLLACWLAFALLRAQAQNAEVPIALQVALLAKLLWYERALQQRADKQVVVLVVERTGDPQSTRAAAQLTAQFDRVKELGGKVVSHTRVSYESAEQIARLVAQRRAYLIYLSEGLATAATELARVLQGQELLIVSANGSDTTRGAVLGFELESSKPRIVLNLKQARAQKLDFSARLLGVARVLP